MDKHGREVRGAEVDNQFLDFMARLRSIGNQNLLDRDYIFKECASLPSHVQAEIRRACLALGIKPLGSHDFKKYNAQAKCTELRLQGWVRKWRDFRSRSTSAITG